jgi:hypothetical protein
VFGSYFFFFFLFGLECVRGILVGWIWSVMRTWHDKSHIVLNINFVLIMKCALLCVARDFYN